MDKKMKDFITKIKNKLLTLKSSLTKNKKVTQNKENNNINSSHVKKLLNNKSKFRKTRINILSVMTIATFIISVVLVLISIINHMKIDKYSFTYLDFDDETRYIVIENGYITERLIIESGTTLPEIRDYFNPEYEIEEDATISYFSGKNQIALDSFTYEKDGDVIVKGVQEIDVVINNGREYSTKLIIRDTTKPDVTLNNLTIKQNESLNPKLFVKSYSDNTLSEDYFAYYPESIDFNRVGDYAIKIKVCDLSNNCFEGVSQLTIEKISTQSSGNSSSGGGSSSGGNSSSGNSSGGNSSSGNSSNGSSSSGGSSSNSGSSSNGSSSSEGTINSTVNSSSKKGSTYTQTERTNKRNEAIEYINNNKQAHDNVTSLFLKNTNILRYEAGVQSLVLDEELCILAQIRAIEIMNAEDRKNASNQHIRPDGTRFNTIFADYGYKVYTSSENYLGGYNINNAEAFGGLKNSSGHYANMISTSSKKMGVAKYTIDKRTIWVQLFTDK